MEDVRVARTDHVVHLDEPTLLRHRFAPNVRNRGRRAEFQIPGLLMRRHPNDYAFSELRRCLAEFSQPGVSPPAPVFGVVIGVPSTTAAGRYEVAICTGRPSIR